jgi:hypothetical protein
VSTKTRALTWANVDVDYDAEKGTHFDGINGLAAIQGSQSPAQLLVEICEEMLEGPSFSL